MRIAVMCYDLHVFVEQDAVVTTTSWPEETKGLLQSLSHWGGVPEMQA